MATFKMFQGLEVKFIQEILNNPQEYTFFIFEDMGDDDPVHYIETDNIATAVDIFDRYNEDYVAVEIFLNGGLVSEKVLKSIHEYKRKHYEQ